MILKYLIFLHQFMSDYAQPKATFTQNILDEDEYLAKLEKIIKRDFFPELKALEELRNGQPQDVDPITEGVSLNQFLANHTSDQHEIFKDIIVKEEQKWKEKHQWMFDIQSRHRERQQAIEDESNKLTNMMEGSRQNKLMLCDYQTMNPLFFSLKCDTITSIQNEIDEKNEKVRKVVIDNTRLEEHDKPFGFAVEQINQQLKDTMKEKLQERLKKQGIDVDFVGSTPNLMGQSYGSKQEQLDKYGHIDLEELMQGKAKKVKETKPIKVNGYDMIQMPSPAPNQLKSPLMTWGEIGETPVRIDRSYHIPHTPQRDQVASDLASQICNKKKTIQKFKQEQLRKTLQGITPHRIDTNLSRIGSSSAKSQLISFLKPSPAYHNTPLDRASKKIRKD